MCPSVPINQAIEYLIKKDVISPGAAAPFISDSEVEVPSLDDLESDPIFLCILIDESCSMKICRDTVLESHKIMFDLLRESGFFRRSCLYLCQYLFSSSPKNMHPFTLLVPTQGSDKVTVLDAANYNPNGRTALYKTVKSSIQDLLVVLSYAHQEGISPHFGIVLITDGEDTEGGVIPSEINNIFQELQNKQILKSSVLVGLLNSNLTKDRLKSIRKTLNFQTLIEIWQNSAHEIRRAFRY